MWRCASITQSALNVTFIQSSDQNDMQKSTSKSKFQEQ